MTIAAGYVCVDGLVLCADTEMTSAVRSTGRKAWYRHDGDSSIALVGAGSAILIRLIRNRLFERIEPDTDLRSAETIIEETLRSIYEDHVDKAPKEKLEDGFDVDVLVGIRHKKHCMLFQHDRTAVADVEYFASIGSGGNLADYLSVALYEQSTVLAASTFASYVLQQCKKFAPYCGGESHIILMPNDGTTDMASPSRVEHGEKTVEVAFSKVRHALKAQLLEVGIPAGSAPYSGLTPTVRIDDQSLKVQLDPEDPKRES
jgi:ATP-dependent protease HslVU (ClpYQ) peptidase subunit